MAPMLKPLLLPQLVEERKKMDINHATAEPELPYALQTSSSSSSDVTSPLTPTFSTRGHFRGSSSTSSLDLAFMASQDSPSSPMQQLSSKTSKRQLPDVQEDPMEREEDRTIIPDPDQFGDEPCAHGTGSEQAFSGDYVVDYDVHYDLGCLSDGEITNVPRQYRKHDGADSPFLGLTSRVGSRFNTLTRWKSNKMSGLMSSSTTEVSLENALSRGPSSRSSSLSASRHQLPERFYDQPQLETPAMSFFDSTESLDLCDMEPELTNDDRVALERERAHATTPLLPPLMTSSRVIPQESPLQSPTIEAFSSEPESHMSPVTSPRHHPHSSISTKGSMSSLRHAPAFMELPISLPPLLQEYDEWSDRLGHANFTITPQPYELDTIDATTVAKFRNDWDAARVNYTKHLVRTGEHYGQTSKIYGFTEAKWAETETRWREIYERALSQAKLVSSSGTNTPNASRSRSRGRGRGRSGSASAVILGRPANDDFFAEAEWRRLEDDMPSAVCRMLEAEGKFPSRGDEDIVGPMHRAEPMARSHSEEKYGSKFWKNLAGKVGLRK